MTTVVMPLKKETYWTSSGYRTPDRPGHRGVDFAANLGTPIYAVADGFAAYVGKNTDPQGYGSWIVLDHQETLGVDSVYGHMHPSSFMVEPGQRVRAGDIIATVGNEGGSSGPHLHFEIFGPPGRFGGTDWDPLKWLRDVGAVEPDTDVTVKPEPPAGVLYGIDISNHQNPFSITQAAREGLDFVFIKATEGTWKDPVFRSHLDEARSTGMIIGAYHYVWGSGSSAAEQAQALADHVNDISIPILLDIEENSGYDPAFFANLAEEIRARGYMCNVTYTGAWYWRQVKGGLDAPLPTKHLWLSVYGPRPAGTPQSTYPGSEGYTLANGERANGWDGMGRHATTIWQFTDLGRVAGHSQIDLNAFRGTREDLIEVLTGERPHASEPAPVVIPQPAEPTKESKMSKKLQDVTGPGITSKFDFESTDLGVMTRMANGEILAIFGDTFRGRGVGVGEWLSPVGLIGHRDENGLVVWDRAAGPNPERAEKFWHYIQGGEAFSTVLPSDVITIGNTTYMHVMVNKGLGNVLWTELWKTNDYGKTWEGPIVKMRPDMFHGLAQLWTMDIGPDGYVYIMSTGFQRDKPLIMFRVKAEDFENPNAYEGWGWANGKWGWGNQPTPILEGVTSGEKFGEMCLRYIDGQWVFINFDASSTGGYDIDVRVLANPTDNMYEAKKSTPIAGGVWGAESDGVVAQLYGPSIVPGSNFTDGFHIFVSQWNTQTGWPYHVMQYEIPVEPVIPIPAKTEPVPTPAEGTDLLSRFDEIVARFRKEVEGLIREN